MLISANKSQQRAGFTLIEILVVLLILTIVFSLAILAFGNRLQDQRLRNSVDELQLVMQFAADQAILQTTPIAIGIGSDGYLFYRYQAETVTQSWQKMDDDHLLGFRSWPKNLTINLSVGGKPIDIDSASIQNPAIIFSPAGNLTPFILLIGKQATIYQLQGSANGDLAIIEQENDV